MGIPTLIKTQTASNSAYIDFIDGTSDVVFDSTYDEYMFVLTDLGPATNDVSLGFQVNATDDAGGDFDTSLMVTTYFGSHHYENDSTTGLAMAGATFLLHDEASFQFITQSQGNGSDESAACILHIFNPSSTTYVKHFIARSSSLHQIDAAQDGFIAGYINDTTAIDEIRFKMESGNFDGVIQMYGIK